MIKTLFSIACKVSNFFIVSVVASLFVVSLSTAKELDGKVLAKQYCAQCHQDDGNSTDENIPKIAGFSAALTYDILDQFRSEYRSAKPIKTKKGCITDMVKISKKLNEDEIEALATYFSTTTFIPAKQAFNQALVETGKQLHLDFCNDCHVDLGTSTDDDAPILAGQWKPYLIAQFKDFTDHKRRMTRRMKKKFRKLNDEDKQALIAFYTSAKPNKNPSTKPEESTQ